MPSNNGSNTSSLPLPPRPDPVTLDQIFDRLTAPYVAMEDRAYHLVALYTVAFHPSVKLFLFEHEPLRNTDATGVMGYSEENTRRREALLKGIAFFLAQRSNAVAQECRWETAALLGELCRMESVQPLRSAGANDRNSTSSINAISGARSYGIFSPKEEVVQKINHYARANLEYLARLPWFVIAVRELIGNEGDVNSAPKTTTSSLELRRALRQRLRRSVDSDGCGLNDDNGQTNLSSGVECDDDTRVALKDILAALPDIVTAEEAPDEGTATLSQTTVVRWSAEQLERACDLMFVDASTTLLHLIPLVSRSSHLLCANCQKHGVKCGGEGLLRCSSCKAVYYCSEECQREHWSAAHRVPCKNYKQRAETILAEYIAANKNVVGGKRGKRMSLQQQEELVAVLEVPLEPSLFYETRRYLYDHRDASFSGVSFYDYFMKYTVRGS
ncbi:MYND finger, putative [Trypanosoma equiperdum]|uniref:MYND finger, putative n=1 Tax=Trypanosoma equiperdum TaxID=5694 RepID=A0A1G4HZ27_TRYEQ|nr:MYND finger, putative [Trypanosoma equiperdum]